MKISRVAVVLAAAVLGAGAGGCGLKRPLVIQPVSSKQAVIQPKFTNVTYRMDRDGTLYFVGRASTYDKALNEYVEQILTVRVFWQPKGGVTSLNKTALNSTYRYVVISPSAVGMYEGAGFVRFGGKVGKAKLSAQLMDGDLRLSEASTSFVDNLGRSNMKGTFTARLDEAATFEGWLKAHRDFFYRSMSLKPKEKREGVEKEATTLPWSPPAPLGVLGESGTQPATQPATQPDTQPATEPTTEPAKAGETQPATQPEREAAKQADTQPATKPVEAGKVEAGTTEPATQKSAVE